MAILGQTGTETGSDGDMAITDTENTFSTRSSEISSPSGMSSFDSDLKSIDSFVSTHICFKNLSTVPIKLFWINYDGDEVPYRTLQHGQSCRQQTFVTHPWTFKSLSAFDKPVACGKRTVVFPTAEEKTAFIDHPSALRWNRHNHSSMFPRDFHIVVRTVLACHHKLQSKTPEKEMTACVGDQTTNIPRDSCCSSPASQEDYETFKNENNTSFGDLPKDILLEILAHAAPYVPDIVPLDENDILSYQQGGEVL